MAEMNPSVDPLAGMRNAWRFACFNGLSFQIVLGSPMILYAKTLNANATVLGIIAGMMPLMVIFQIPAAHYISRIGYKRFVLACCCTMPALSTRTTPPSPSTTSSPAEAIQFYASNTSH